MKTKTIVELTGKEVTDALVEVAKQQCKPKGGGVKIRFSSEGKVINELSVEVVFEWGANGK